MLSVDAIQLLLREGVLTGLTALGVTSVVCAEVMGSLVVDISELVMSAVIGLTELEGLSSALLEGPIGRPICRAVGGTAWPSTLGHFREQVERVLKVQYFHS